MIFDLCLHWQLLPKWHKSNWWSWQITSFVLSRQLASVAKMGYKSADVHSFASFELFKCRTGFSLFPHQRGSEHRLRPVHKNKPTQETSANQEAVYVTPSPDWNQKTENEWSVWIAKFTTKTKRACHPLFLWPIFYPLFLTIWHPKIPARNKKLMAHPQQPRHIKWQNKIENSTLLKDILHTSRRKKKY